MDLDPNLLEASQQNSKLPAKSCLKNTSLSNISNHQVAAPTSKKKRKVRFNLPEPKSIKDAVPVLDLDEKVLNILRSLGDHTAALVQKIDEAAEELQIFANFQRGFLPNCWFDYFGSLIKKKTYLGVKRADALPDVLPDDLASADLFFVIDCPSNVQLAELLQRVRSVAAKSRTVLLYGDIEMMLRFSETDLLSRMEVLNFVVTNFDIIRRFPEIPAGFIDIALSDSGGIPITAFEIWQNNKLTCPDVPWMKYLHEPAVISNEDYQALFFRLYVHSLRQQPIPDNWTFGKVKYSMIARACCFLLAPNQTAAVCSDDTGESLEDKSSPGSQQAGQQGESVEEKFSPGSQQVAPSSQEQAPNGPLYVVVPKLLAERYLADNPTYECLAPNEQLAWVMMELVACHNMICLQGAPQMTFGQRFSFLADSFVRDLQHNIRGQKNLPKVSGWKPRYRNVIQLLFEVPTIGRSDWPAMMRDLLSVARLHNCVLKPGTASNSPDFMVVIDKDHVLCAQLKSGVQNPSYQSLLNELYKCPLMQTIRWGILKFSGDFKLTFVFAAMNHSKLKKHIAETKPELLPQVKKLDCYRLDSNFDGRIPENVEVIVLRKAGLHCLLGKEHYNYIAQCDASLDKEATKVITQFEHFQSAPYAGGQTTSNVVTMMHKLFPEWVSTLTTPEAVQEFLEQFLPHITAQYELSEVNPAFRVVAAQPFSLARTFSQRDDEEAEQSLGKKPKIV